MTQATKHNLYGRVLKRWAIHDGATPTVLWAESRAQAARTAGVSIRRVEPIAADWRNEPRTPRGRKTKTITVRLTSDQFAAIRANAKAQELTLAEWVVERCG